MTSSRGLQSICLCLCARSGSACSSDLLRERGPDSDGGPCSRRAENSAAGGVQRRAGGQEEGGRVGVLIERGFSHADLDEDLRNGLEVLQTKVRVPKPSSPYTTRSRAFDMHPTSAAHPSDLQFAI